MLEPIAIFLSELENTPIGVVGAWKLKELGYYILSNDLDLVLQKVGWPLPHKRILLYELNGGIAFPTDNDRSWIVVAPNLQCTCLVRGVNLVGAIEYAVCKNCGIESRGRYVCTECGEVFKDMISAHLTMPWKVIR
jgi:hypothetical protein